MIHRVNTFFGVFLSLLTIIGFVFIIIGLFNSEVPHETCEKLNPKFAQIFFPTKGFHKGINLIAVDSNKYTVTLRSFRWLDPEFEGTFLCEDLVRVR